VNCLNSILLEGKCALKPRTVTAPDGKLCEFSIISCRYKHDGMKEESTFEVEAGGRLGEQIAFIVKEGRGIRVVGRLRETKSIDASGFERSSVRIVAEHVELKREGAGL